MVEVQEIQNEEKSIEIQFTLYLPEHSREMWLYTHAEKMYSLLWDLDKKCRDVLKYEDSPSEERLKLAEAIRKNIWDEVNLEMLT